MWTAHLCWTQQGGLWDCNRWWCLSVIEKAPKKAWHDFFLPFSSEKAEEIGWVCCCNGWSPSTAQISWASVKKAAIFAVLHGARGGSMRHWVQSNLKCNENPVFNPWFFAAILSQTKRKPQNKTKITQKPLFLLPSRDWISACTNSSCSLSKPALERIRPLNLPS